MPSFKDGSATSDPERDKFASNQREKNDIMDPSLIFGGRDARHVSGKVGQLCRQVLHAIDDALAECDDPELQSLMVRSVKPAPHARRLMVTLAATWHDDEDGPFDAEYAQKRLGALKGYLRCEVASAISRRKVPELTFYVLRPGEVER